MATEIKQYCVLEVGSAELTSNLSNKPPNLYVEIRVDGVSMQCTDVIWSETAPSWDQKFLIFGNSSSIISMSVNDKLEIRHIPDTCIGRADIPLGTLLTTCAEDAAFEVMLMVPMQEGATMGKIMVKFGLLGDLDGIAEALSVDRFFRIDQFAKRNEAPHYVKPVKSDNENENEVELMGSSSSSQKFDLDDVIVELELLGIQQRDNFECLGNLADLDSAISNQQKVVQLTDERHPYMQGHLWVLGNSLQIRYNHLGELADLENAISNHLNAVQLTDNDHPFMPVRLSDLASSLLTRFERLGELADLEHAISNNEKAVMLADDGHPEKPMCLSNLGNSQQARFGRFGELVDIENAISNNQMAIKLRDDGHPDIPRFLSNLGNSQGARFLRLGGFADIENAVSNLQNAVKLTDDGHISKPTFLANLGHWLGARFEHLGTLSDLEDAIWNQQKSVDLTDDANYNLPGRLSNLGSCQKARFKRLGELADLENATLNIEKAVRLTDDGHPSKPMLLSNLGSSQQARFNRLGDLTYLDHAISNLQDAVKLTDNMHPDKPMYLASLGITQDARFDRLGELANIKDAISNKQMAIKLTDDGHPDIPSFLSTLGNSQHALFHHLGKLADLENAISNLQNAVKLTKDGHVGKPAFLTNLGSTLDTRFDQLGKLDDLEDAISSLQKSVQLTEDGNPGMPIRLSNLGNCQTIRFERLGELADLENSISNNEKAVRLTDDDHPDQSRLLLHLGNSWQSRFKHLNKSPDLVAAISAYRKATRLETAHPQYTLLAARAWAEASHENGDLLSALDGYRTVLQVLPKVAWLGLDAASHHDLLIREKSENLGCLAATCAIQLGRLEEAVELLDMGRSVYWRQASSLRIDLEVLREAEPELAIELETVGRKLDEQIFGVHRDDAGMKQHHLVGEWEELVVRVRQLPHFEYFLKPIPFQQLRQVATAGWVVVINVSKYGVDALIFSATGAIEHVSLPDIDLDILVKLSSDVILKRPVNASAIRQRSYTNRFLQPALRTVWDDILVHIFDKIRIPLAYTAVQFKPRIWWYPTGPLSFIPIHAAGPRSGIDVSQLVISSYLTTLESVFQARKKKGPVVNRQQKFLSVSQPETPDQCSLPQTAQEVDEVLQVFQSSGWSKKNIVCLRGTEATVDGVSHALDSCSWIHLACHGSQHPKLGMKSAFMLHDGHLELGEIASKRLSTGQFAFLSACHASSGLHDLPGEAMHLAAGLQFSGFPSVIATMWSICDKDAPRVAEHTYKYLFRNGLQGLDPAEAPIALNCAISCLREDPKVTVDRWAPFVHFGI